MYNKIMTVFLIMTTLGTTAFAMKDAKGSAEAGEKVYRSNCLNCHGSKGKGDGPIAASLTPPPADLSNPKVQDKEDEALLSIIQNGITGTSMPAWKNDLSNQQILDVFTYLRTLHR